jgi:hypothetical protein
MDFDIRYHWIRDILNSESIELEKIHIDDNSADMCTKALPRLKFQACRLGAGLATSST